MYARVEGGSSPLPGTNLGHAMLEAQSDGLCKCAEVMDFELAEKDAELARMGISERAMQRMLEAAETGEIQAVMIAACSRLHRDSEQALNLLEKLNRCGVHIYSQQEGWVNVPCEEGYPTMLQLLQTLRSMDRKDGRMINHPDRKNDLSYILGRINSHLSTEVCAYILGADHFLSHRGYAHISGITSSLI